MRGGMIWGCFRASVRRIKRAAGRELSLCCWELGVRHPVSCCSAQTLLEKLFPLLFLAPHSLPALNIRYTNTHNRPARPHRQHRTTTHLLPPPPPSPAPANRAPANSQHSNLPAAHTQAIHPVQQQPGACCAAAAAAAGACSMVCMHMQLRRQLRPGRRTVTAVLPAWHGTV